MTRLSLKFIQIGVTIALFCVVFYQAGLFDAQGRNTFLQLFAQADWRLLVLSLLIGVLVNAASALKWYMLCLAQNMRVSYGRTFAYYLVGQFYNLILPTSVGGDVVRSYEMGKYTGRKGLALASVFVERYTGIVVLLIMAAIAVMLHLATFNVQFVLVSLVFFIVGLGVLGWLMFDQRAYQRVRHGLLQRIPKLESVLNKVDSVFASIADYRRDKKALFWAVMNSFLFYFLAVLNVYVTALVFDWNVGLYDMLVATPIIMLLMNIPLSIGNLGIMEFAYTTVFQLMGYSPALGLSVALLMRLKSLLDGAMGGVLMPVFTTRQHQ